LFGVPVSDIQANDVKVENGAITGTLKYISTGTLATDWGAGNFIALKFKNNDENVTKIKVGLDPSQSSGLVELDSDMNGVFKITDKNAQKFVVECYDKDNNKDRYEYSLKGLTLNNA